MTDSPRLASLSDIEVGAKSQRYPPQTAMALKLSPTAVDTWWSDSNAALVLFSSATTGGLVFDANPNSLPSPSPARLSPIVPAFHGDPRLPSVVEAKVVRSMASTVRWLKSAA